MDICEMQVEQSSEKLVEDLPVQVLGDDELARVAGGPMVVNEL